MSRFFIVFLSSVMLVVTGCVSLPSGPDVMVLPGTGLSFEQFRNDDAVCQQFASYRIGGTTANQAGVNSGVTSAAVGTALGAAAGAAIGGGSGAAIGAGSGLVGGSLVGAGAANSSMYETQQRYDTAYIQCMYAKGHQVPVSGQFSGATSHQVAPSSHIPPPPPGSSPPPHIPPPPPGQPPAPPPQ
ncbi:glycine zipper family protein [Methylobacter sp.]|uniref:glycine zipper family protein n=1 Tax=Methylobacter sp. TaxID=2051955 RepID=UPI002FDD3374